MTIFLGISAFYHDSAAAIIKDGEILSAVQEERLSRVKHDSNFPQTIFKSKFVKKNRFCNLLLLHCKRNNPTKK